MKTGERIKQLRISKGMTQEELGEKVGVKKAAIYKYETGLVVNLKRDVIEKLAQVLDVSPSYLMGLDDQDELNLKEDCSQINDVYLSIAKDAQDNQIDPDDLKAIIELLKKKGR